MKTACRLILTAILAAAFSGCTTSVSRTADRAKPGWYHATDPAPDDRFLYFTGYSEGCFSFSQARTVAEQNARKRVGAYLGTQIMDELEQVTARAGSNWADSVPPDGLLARIFTDMNAPSAEITDRMRNEVTTYVNELVRRARVNDLYVETVTIKEGLDRYRRYDAGVLLEFPRSELERIDRREKMEQQKRSGLSRRVRQAEALWNTGKKKEALGLLQTETRKNPFNAELLVRLAQFQEEANRSDDALKNYMKAAEQEPENSRWGRLARSRIAALAHVRLAGFLQLASKYDGLAGGTLTDGIGWMQQGHLSRARRLFREKYEADSRSQSDLWAWYLAAARESAGGSMAAKYDLSKSLQQVSEHIAGYESGQQALPAVVTLLTFIRQGIEVPTAIDSLSEIKKAVGPASFPPEIGNMAVLALGKNSDSKAQAVLRWLNNSDS